MRVLVLVGSVFASLAIFTDATTGVKPRKHDKKKPHCKHDKLNGHVLFQKSMFARTLAAAGKGDPTCKSGIGGKYRETPVCCPAYCGECTDYPTCRSVKGQASGSACCATQVAKSSCASGKADAARCVPSCNDKGPPCILDKAVPFEAPAMTSAAEDCNEAVPEWMDKAETSVKSAKGGAAQWDTIEMRGKIY